MAASRRTSWKVGVSRGSCCRRTSGSGCPRIGGNASREVNYEFEQLARGILADVTATDATEDEECGAARGDGLPEQLRSAEGRREFFRRAREQEGPEPVTEPEPQVAAEVP